MIRARLGEKAKVPFVLNNVKVLSRPVYGFEQTVLPQSLVPGMLYLIHHSKIAVHPGGRCLYPFLRRRCSWPDMSVDCYPIAKSLVHCKKYRVVFQVAKTCNCSQHQRHCSSWWLTLWVSCSPRCGGIDSSWLSPIGSPSYSRPSLMRIIGRHDSKGCRGHSGTIVWSA